MIRLDLTSNEDAIQRNPYWIALVFPFAQRETFDSATLTDIGNPETILNITTPLVLSKDILNFTVTTGMDSPVGNLTLNLAASFYEKVDRLGSEDWIVFWAMDNKADYTLIKQGLNDFANNGTVSDIFNTFKNSPKFIGQVSSIFQAESIDSMGTISVIYEMFCYSNTFLQSKQYVDQTLNALGPEVSRWWSQYKGFSDKTVAGNIKAQEAMQRLIHILLAVGPNIAAPVDRHTSPNEKYSVPVELVRLFNPDFKEKQATIIDLYHFWFGVQKYKNNITTLSPDGLIPDLTPRPEFPTFNETARPLVGEVQLGALDFNNVSVYTILQQYLSSPINEIYCCMRPRPSDKKMFPTLIVRQNPKVLFTKWELPKGEDVKELIPTEGIFSDLNKSMRESVVKNASKIDLEKVTLFSELPVWRISAKLIHSKRVGLSGASKMNYVQITPVNAARSDQGRTPTNALYAKAITDTANILRNGLQPLITLVPMIWVTKVDEANNKDLSEQNSFFNKMMASITFNNHLKFSGNIEVEGIQAPIECGDCCEVDNVVYFIERIQHTGGITGSGIKVARTLLTLSDGVVINEKGEYAYPSLAKIRHSVTSE